jgi:hypothetical protein
MCVSAGTFAQPRKHLGARGSNAKCLAHEDNRRRLDQRNPAGKVLHRLTSSRV